MSSAAEEPSHTDVEEGSSFTHSATGYEGDGEQRKMRLIFLPAEKQKRFLTF